MEYMETIDSLEAKLTILRQKWRSWPKSHHDPRWWRFKCDETLALRYKTQIAILKRDEKNRPLNPSETEAVAQMIFGKDT
jgi:hypothetical protein